MQVEQFGVVAEHLEAMGKTGRNQQATAIARTQVLGMPVQECGRVGTQVHRHVPDFTAQASNQLGFRHIALLVVQAANAAFSPRAGVVDLAHMKRRAQGTQAAFAEQPRKLPSSVFVAFVLQAEKSPER
ncbi:hypothetical protein D3C71_1876210 [compost metagenome]